MNDDYIDFFNEEDKKRLSNMLILSRAESGLSQERVALELGITRKTVQNWERGISAPTLPQAISWFRVMKIAAMPYLIQFIFPDMEGISAKDSDDKLRKELLSLIEAMPAEGVRQLMYLLYADHGSSPRAALNLMTAHLQCSLRDRYHHAKIIIDDYKLSYERNETVQPQHIQPNVELIDDAIAQSRTAILNEKNNYMLV